MKVLVTGAAGFIGSHVVEELLRSGADVRALAHYNSEGRSGHLRFVERERWGARLQTVFGDVDDRRMLRDTAADCEAIVHLAALIGIPYSYTAPEAYLRTNLYGTFNVLEVARELRLRRVVVTSTSEVYGSAVYTPIDEDHPLQAQSPYSASKIAADKLAESYALSFDLPVVTLRPFNTYGPRQSARAIVPAILSQLAAGTDVLRLGSVAPQRDLVFVGDTARAFRLALETDGVEGETIHCGTGRAVSIVELAEMCIRSYGGDVEILEDPDRVRPARSEVGLLLASSAKAGRLLGWKPEISLEKGLEATRAFVEANPDLYDVARYAV